MNHVLFVVLNEESKMKRLIKSFADIGVRGATVIRTHGMAHYLVEDIPMMGILGSVLSGDVVKKQNYTVLSVIETDAKLARAIRSANEVVGDFSKPGSGFLFSMPAQNVTGLAQPLKR